MYWDFLQNMYQFLSPFLIFSCHNLSSICLSCVDARLFHCRVSTVFSADDRRPNALICHTWDVKFFVIFSLFLYFDLMSSVLLLSSLERVQNTIKNITITIISHQLHLMTLVRRKVIVRHSTL